MVSFRGFHFPLLFFFLSFDWKIELVLVFFNFLFPFNAVTVRSSFLIDVLSMCDNLRIV